MQKPEIITNNAVQTYSFSTSRLFRQFAEGTMKPPDISGDARLIRIILLVRFLRPEHDAHNIDEQYRHASPPENITHIRTDKK
jgi:hypothetical protein